METVLTLPNTKIVAVIDVSDGLDDELEMLTQNIADELKALDDIEPETLRFYALECFYNEALEGVHYSPALDDLIGNILMESDFYTFTADVKFRKVVLEK